MTLLEQKVDAIGRVILANDSVHRNAAIAELDALMKKPKCTTEGAETVARNLLVEIGVPEHILGSKYLISAICAVVEDANVLRSVTGVLYPTVAQKFGTTGSRVERGIRHAIEVSWDRGDMDVLYKYFGNTVSGYKGKPTNSEFISRVANVVRERIGGG